MCISNDWPSQSTIEIEKSEFIIVLTTRLTFTNDVKLGITISLTKWTTNWINVFIDDIINRRMVGFIWNLYLYNIYVKKSNNRAEQLTSKYHACNSTFDFQVLSKLWTYSYQLLLIFNIEKWDLKKRAQIVSRSNKLNMSDWFFNNVLLCCSCVDLFGFFENDKRMSLMCKFVSVQYWELNNYITDIGKSL